MEGSIEEDSIPDANVIQKEPANFAHKSNIRSTCSSGVSTVISSGQLIQTANGQTVVFTGPSAAVSTISSVSTSNNNHHHQQQQHHHHHHHHNANKSLPTVAQSLAVSGGMSIVHFQLPNQSNMVQSVIQPNHQSVIQATNTASIPALQLTKNVILLNKVSQGSVIHSTESDHNIQLIKEENEAVNQAMFEDESKRRREILARRPSYRKILNELSSTETGSGSVIEGKNNNDDNRESQSTAISLPASYLKVLPGSAIQIGSQDGSATIQGIPTIMTNANSGSSANTIVQYATSGHEGQFIVPTDLQAYQLRPPNQSGIAQNVVMTATNISSHILDEASKKRELRLLKNREAAKECRRKKKEYIKCLENRVAVLENQNKALIDELKTLKELYCKKSE